ncbi:MAG: xanthine dehydrogenase family protein subunit M [Candidatus Stygibacter frigidus]|nr:xanthine dehydrogenase family protein subunit M [Candidatus Stygibacter frigidus]
MKVYKPDNLPDTLHLLSKLPGKKLLLAGGSDLNILIKQGKLSDEAIIFINHLPELHGVDICSTKLIIGATTTISEISGSAIIKEYCPYLSDSLIDFASPPIANFATLAGNIANSSPTADTVPLLLVLEAKLVLKSVTTTRIVPISEFYTGYKKTVLRDDEMIIAIEIPLNFACKYQPQYVKIGSRTALTIAKVALAFVKYEDNFRIAAGSLNEFPRRLYNVEEYLTIHPQNIDASELMDALKMDVTPISDFRSDKEYRLQVCFNYLQKFIESANTD